MNVRQRIIRPVIIGIAALAWTAGVSYGAVRLFRFESTPGAIGLTPEVWPSQATIHRTDGVATAVMLVHPECSCTSASLSELAEVVRHARGPLSVWVLLVMPEGLSLDAEPRRLAVQRIPGVHIRLDPGGSEAARFGALTSGFIVLYDARGQLRFAGGITAARGHAGRNVGRDQLLDAIDEVGSANLRHPVYGCAL